MKKFFILKSLLMLCALFGGVGNAIANDYDYVEWVKVTNLSEVQSGDVVVLVSSTQDGNIALPNNSTAFKGVSVTPSGNNKITDVSNDIQWTVTKDNNVYTFKCGTSPLTAQLGNSPSLSVGGSGTTSAFSFGVYESTGGTLSCSSNNTTYYIYWYVVSTNEYQAKLQTTNSGAAEFLLYKKVVKKNYVKWKEVSFANLADGSTVVIVDKATGKAMTNDKGTDSKPGFSDVELNADKDRIMSDVDANIQWKVTNVDGKVKFGLDATNFLCVASDKNELRVGTTEPNTFGFKNDFLYVTKDKDYYVGVKSQMIVGDSWEIIEEGESEAVSDNIKNTQIAFYMKVDDTQAKTTLSFPYENYETDMCNYNSPIEIATLSVTGALNPTFTYTSSNEAVATVGNDGKVTLIKRGTTTITVRVAETDDYDKASASYTLRVDDSRGNLKGSRNNPLTVEEAKDIAQHFDGNTTSYTKDNVTYEAGCSYFVKGIVSKANSGLLSIFADMGLNLDDVDLDLDIDLGALNIPGLDMSSITYYISDNGTTTNQLKVQSSNKGNKGTTGATETGGVEFSTLESSNIGVGDVVTVYGPLVYSEDSNMSTSLGIGGNSEPTYSPKMGDDSYVATGNNVMLHRLISFDKEMKVDAEKVLPTTTGDNEFFTLNVTDINGTIGTPSFKSGDTDIATVDNGKLKALKVGTTKIIVSIPVILTDDDPNTEQNEEVSYTMKTKFNLKVTSRDLPAAGSDYGEYQLVTTSSTALAVGDKLVLTGSADDKNYIMGGNSSSSTSIPGMGGNISGQEVTVSNNKIAKSDVPDGAYIVTLEDAGNSKWYLKVEDGDYLCAVEETSSTSTFNFGSTTLKKAAMKDDQGNPLTGDALEYFKASITIDSNGKAIIKFNAPSGDDKKNVIKFSNSSIINIGGNGNGNGNGGGNNAPRKAGTTSSFDTSMPSFSCDATANVTAEYQPSIYRFAISETTYNINIGDAHWATIVPAFDMDLPNDLKAYAVTGVSEGKVTLSNGYSSIKTNNPYLLHGDRDGEFTLTKSENNVDEPENNILAISTNETTGESGTSQVYVLTRQKVDEHTYKAGFKKWTGGKLGAGRVYLHLPAQAGAAPSFIPFDETTGIVNVSREAITDNQYYTLDGRRVERPTKGLYIVNGKKVVIK